MTTLIPGSTLQVKWSFVAENPDELSVEAGVTARLIELKDDWVLVEERSSGRCGLIPLLYVDVIESAPSSPPIAASVSSASVSSGPKPKTPPTVPPKQFKTKLSAGDSTSSTAVNSNLSGNGSQKFSGSAIPSPPKSSVNVPGTATAAAKPLTPAFPKPMPPITSSTSTKSMVPESATTPFRLPPLPASKPATTSSSLTNATFEGPPSPKTVMDGSQSKKQPIVSSTARPADANPFDQFQAVHPPVNDDALAQQVYSRLDLLKARIANLDSDVLEAEVVPPPIHPLMTYQSSASVASTASYPSSVRPPSTLAAEEEERRRRLEEERLREEQARRDREEKREKERLRLLRESELRAQQQQMEAAQAEERRRQQQQEDLDRIRRNSAILGARAQPEANCMLLANEKLKEATKYDNNQKIAQAALEYVKVLKYMQEAFDKRQIAPFERAENLARMQQIVDKLSAPPFSADGSFTGKIDVLAAMGRSGFDLTARADTLRKQGFQMDTEKNYPRAVHYYKAAVECYIAHKKAVESMRGMVDPSVTAAMMELLNRAEMLKSLMSS